MSKYHGLISFILCIAGALIFDKAQSFKITGYVLFCYGAVLFVDAVLELMVNGRN